MIDTETLAPRGPLLLSHAHGSPSSLQTLISIPLHQDRAWWCRRCHRTRPTKLVSPRPIKNILQTDLQPAPPVRLIACLPIRLPVACLFV